MDLDASKKECKRLLKLIEKERVGSEKKRDLIILLFPCAIKIALTDSDPCFRGVLIEKIKEAMGASFMFPSMDRLKEFLLLLENVDWRPWLHDEKFPKRFRCSLSTLVVLAKAGTY